MKISDEQIRYILDERLAAELEVIEAEASPKLTDGPMLERVTAKVLEMGDREDMISELKARIEAGEYNPSGDEIADRMIRRAIADRLRF